MYLSTTIVIMLRIEHEQHVLFTHNIQHEKATKKPLILSKTDKHQSFFKNLLNNKSNSPNCYGVKVRIFGRVLNVIIT